MQPDPPLQRLLDEPPVQRVAGRRCAPPARLVRGEEVVEPTQPPTSSGSPKRHCHAQPGEVLHRIAEVHDLPVDHRGQDPAVDHDVADAEVAVDDQSARGAGGGPQPARTPSRTGRRSSSSRYLSQTRARRAPRRRAPLPRAGRGARRGTRPSSPTSTSRAVANSVATGCGAGVAGARRITSPVVPSTRRRRRPTPRARETGALQARIASASSRIAPGTPGGRAGRGAG